MLKQILTKYIGQVLILVTIIGVVLFTYSKWRDANEERKYANLIGTQEKYEQLNKYTAKLESDYKSQKDLIKKASKDFAEYKRSSNERIKLLSDATYLIGKHVQKQNGPDYLYTTPKGTRNYLLNEIRIAGADSPAIGYILIKNDGRTYKRNYAFEIQVSSLQTIDEDTGRVKVISKAFLIPKENSLLAKRISGYKDWKDIKYPLEITGGVAYIDPTMSNTRSKFQWWAPHINGGISMGSFGNGDNLRPTLDVSLSGYGKTKNDLDWKLLHLGTNFNAKAKDVGLYIVPFSYRPFNKFITNTYIGPAISWDKDGKTFNLNVNLGF